MKRYLCWLALTMALTVCTMAQEETVNEQHGNSDRDIQIPLFNGKDFTGFTFCMLNGADPAKTWTVTNGLIHCTGTPYGYLRTTSSFSNCWITVQWRFVKVAPNADNTGILFDMQLPDKVWPRCVQVQGKHDHVGDLFLMGGADSKEHKGIDEDTPLPLRGPSHENPVGEWNTAETICIHHTVVSFINGFCVNETTETTVNDGFIGIQSEGGEIEIRSIYFTPLKY